MPIKYKNQMQSGFNSIAYYIFGVGGGDAYELCKLTLIVPKNTGRVFSHESNVCMGVSGILSYLRMMFYL